MKSLSTTLLTAVIATSSLVGLAGNTTVKNLIGENVSSPTAAAIENVVSQTNESSVTQQPVLVSQVVDEYEYDPYIECVIWERC